jgi:hypothetical protein
MKQIYETSSTWNTPDSEDNVDDYFFYKPSVSVKRPDIRETELLSPAGKED